MTVSMNAIPPCSPVPNLAEHEQPTIQANMFMYVQAILDMLFTLSQFIYYNIDTKQPQPSSYHPQLSNHLSVEQQSSQMVLLRNKVELGI